MRTQTKQFLHLFALLVTLSAGSVVAFGSDQIRIRQGTPATGGGGGGGGSTGTCDADHLSDCPRLPQSALLPTTDGGFCPPDYSNNGLYITEAPDWSIAYDDSDNTMWVTTATVFGGKGIAHINIPAPVSTSNPALMNMATYAASTAIREPTEGEYPNSWPLSPSTDGILTTPTALLPWGNRICGTFQYYYENGSATTRPFYCRPKNLATSGDVDGMMSYTFVSSPDATNRMMTAFCGTIPSEWQTALGGVAWCGAGNTYSIVSNQSYGPSMFVINPDNIAAGTGNARGLIYYPNSHQTLGGWDLGDYGAGEMMDFTTQITGAAMINGTRTMVFFGVTGTTACYGPGLSDPNDPRIGTPTGDGEDLYCYDPTNSNKANHGYPYAYRMWAVDLLDLKRVKDGEINPWEVIPYGFWTITFPISPGTTVQPISRGLAYNPALQHLYLVQGKSGCSGNNGVFWRYPVDITP